MFCMGFNISAQYAAPALPTPHQSMNRLVPDAERLSRTRSSCGTVIFRCTIWL
jgi:hypothetical protein